MAQATWILSSVSRFINLLEDSPSVTSECLQDVSALLMPSHLRSIADERAVQNRCGLPTCQAANTHAPSGSSRPMYTLEMGKVLDVSVSRLFCSAKCVDSYFAIRKKLSCDPPHLRRNVDATLEKLATLYLEGPLAIPPTGKTDFPHVTDSNVQDPLDIIEEANGENGAPEDLEVSSEDAGPLVDVSVPSTARLWDMITTWITPTTDAFIVNPAHVLAMPSSGDGSAANVDGYRPMPTVGSQTSALRLQALESLLTPHFRSVLRVVGDVDERVEALRDVTRLLGTLRAPVAPNVIEGECARYHGTAAVNLSHKEARILALVFIHAVASQFVREKIQPQIDDQKLGYNWTILSYPWL